MERAGYTADDCCLQTPRPSRSSGSKALLRFKGFAERRLLLISSRYSSICFCVFGKVWLYGFMILFCSTAPNSNQSRRSAYNGSDAVSCSSIFIYLMSYRRAYTTIATHRHLILCVFCLLILNRKASDAFPCADISTESSRCRIAKVLYIRLSVVTKKNSSITLSTSGMFCFRPSPDLRSNPWRSHDSCCRYPLSAMPSYRAARLFGHTNPRTTF